MEILILKKSLTDLKSKIERIRFETNVPERPRSALAVEKGAI